MHDALPTPACLNCGAVLAGGWCSQCGQRAAEIRPTMHELLHEALHEFSHLDGKIIQTAQLLFTKPGELTREFVAGRRARYVTPIRLYLICSLLFFALLSVLPAGQTKVKITKVEGASPQLTRAAERVNKDPSILLHALATALPKAMFILMPLFGLIVYAFYFRAERTYVPHFYFAVHYHAFAFVVLTVMEVTKLSHSWPAIILRVLLLLTIIPYLAIALHRVYGGTRLAAALKGITALVIYAVFILLTMAFIALFTLRRLKTEAAPASAEVIFGHAVSGQHRSHSYDS
jgi:uncharacterized protein DUF3667